MKIIDERGRVFGKINIIDFTVILFLVLIMPMFYYGQRFFRKPVATVRNNIWLEVTVKFTGISPEATALLRDGDVELCGSDKPIGILKKIISIKNTEMSFFNPNENRMVVVGDPLRRDIVAVFDLDCFIQLGTPYYKIDDYPIRVGNVVGFYSDRYVILGQIIDLKKSSFEH